MNLRKRLGDSPPRMNRRRDQTAREVRATPQEATATPSGRGSVADRGARGTRAQRSAEQLRRREARMLEVTDREQQRIGQELHDGLGQRLTALEMRLFLLKEELAGKDLIVHRTRIRKEIAQISQDLRECIGLTRAIAHGLAPVSLGPNGLASALRQLAAGACVAGKVDCRFNCLEPVKISDPNILLQFYRIAQEAVNNALKHSHTRRIRIQLVQNSRRVVVRVEDFGRGLPRKEALGGGIGLELMRHRARSIGASLAIQSIPGSGVRITCTLPTGRAQPAP